MSEKKGWRGTPDKHPTSLIAAESVNFKQRLQRCSAHIHSYTHVLYKD